MPPSERVISTTPSRVSTSAPFLITEGSSGTNFELPGSLTRTLPLIGFIPTLWPATGVGAGEGVGVGCCGSVTIGGGDVAVVNAWIAGEPTFPAPSIARTENVCGPGPSGAVVYGEVHAANASASTRHWNVAPASDVN